LIFKQTESSKSENLKRLLILSIFGLSLSFSVIANAGIFGAGNYADCILENIKPNLSRDGALAVAYSCKKKYPSAKSIGIFDFGNFEDCLLEHVKPNMDRVSINYIRAACRNKYPEEEGALDKLLREN
jgi:methyl coenzyme M reductase subunit C-like uncharacterized protein (methanogenesis marker protein 7)